jgi:hypothetical protein
MNNDGGREERGHGLDNHFFGSKRNSIFLVILVSISSERIIFLIDKGTRLLSVGNA